MLVWGQVDQRFTFDFHLHREPIRIINDDHYVDPARVTAVSHRSNVGMPTVVKMLDDFLLFNVPGNRFLVVGNFEVSEHTTDFLSGTAEVAQGEHQHTDIRLPSLSHINGRDDDKFVLRRPNHGCYVCLSGGWLEMHCSRVLDLFFRSEFELLVWKLFE